MPLRAKSKYDGHADGERSRIARMLRMLKVSRASAMKRPVVGVIGNTQRVENRFATQAVGERNMRAVAEIAGALPLMFASTPAITDGGALLDAVDGILLTASRAHRHPSPLACRLHPK